MSNKDFLTQMKEESDVFYKVLIEKRTHRRQLNSQYADLRRQTGNAVRNVPAKNSNSDDRLGIKRLSRCRSTRPCTCLKPHEQKTKIDYGPFLVSSKQVTVARPEYSQFPMSTARRSASTARPQQLPNLVKKTD